MKKQFFLLLLFFLCISNTFAQLSLEKQWEFSQSTSTLPAWVGATTERSMTVRNGKLYIASRNGGNKILVLDTEDGNLISTLSLSSELASGTLKGNNLGVTNDEVILIGNGAVPELSIQTVDRVTGKVTSVPLLKTLAANVAYGGRIDGWGVYGTLADGYIAVPTSVIDVGTGKDVLIYTLENGSVKNPTGPIQIESYTGTSATIYPVDENKFYTLGRGSVPKLFVKEGSEWEISPDQFTGTDKPGTLSAGGAQFSYNGKTYFVSAGNSIYGGLDIFDITSGLAQAKKIDLSANALGNAGNASYTCPVAVEVKADGAYIYVLATNNGIAAYKLSEKTISGEETKLPNFVTSRYYDEQVLAYTYNPDIKIEVNAPSAMDFDPDKPTAIVMYGLPNGNTTDWTIGKQAATGDDWHYQIQHIGAQTRFLRKQNLDFNLVTVYMEATQLSWSTWRNANTNGNQIIKDATEKIMALFSDYNPYIILNGHSGGGNFPFGFMDAVTEIPSYVKRISFLDSNYNWDNSRYGAKLKKWLEASPENHLSVIAYNDSVALLNGQPIVSATGGTWYRSRVMQKYLKENLPSLNWQESENAEFITYSADNNRIQFLLKQNPTQVIYHTVLVEKNGYIQSVLSGTAKEGQGYTFWGNHAYDNLIQSATVYPHILRIPPREPNAIGGSAFMEKIKNMSLEDREFEIYREISNGNIPNAFRQSSRITQTLADANGTSYSVDYEMLPDFLAVGSDDDFCRIPMLPGTAQRIATLFGATLPTSKLSDLAHQNAIVKLSPKTMTPDNTMTTVPVFITHNQEVENARIPLGESLESLIAGHKKDIVIHSRLMSNPNSVIIYGWHYTNGSPIQPVYAGHSNQYVDYSHGVRIINQEILVDGKNSKIRELLRDKTKHKLFSDEASALTQTEYATGATITPPSAVTTFAIEQESPSSVSIVWSPQSNLSYKVVYGTDVNNLDRSFDLGSANAIIGDLESGQIYYFAMYASNVAGDSPISEKLGACLTDKAAGLLIVNGFDRPMSGNTYDFVKEHGIAARANGYPFVSATNEAVSGGLIDLKNYTIVNYILGEESTQHKTFDATEQTIVKSYLQNGGHLLVTSAEIGWDLGRPTSGAASNNFMNDYLKCTYVSDNPDGGAGFYHDAKFILGTDLGGDEYTFSFGNGPSGTSVQYPDVLQPAEGTEGFLQFVKDGVGYDTSKGFAGVAYSGLFAGGNKKGKVITMSIPLESINPEASRIEVMKYLLKYLEENDDRGVQISKNTDIRLDQNIPNPAKSITYITYNLPETTYVELVVWDLTGRKIGTLVSEEQSEGIYSIPFDVNDLADGIYIYRLSTGKQILSKKMIVKK